MKRTILLFILTIVAIAAFFILNLLLGTVRIPMPDVCRILVGDGGENEIWRNIIMQSRVPQALTALMAGAGLAVSGLQMQTVFHNPLAGPSVLGISNGASLGVACVVLLSGSVGGVTLSRMGYVGDVAISISAIIGALAVLLLIVVVARHVRGNVTLLIIGVMIGYLATAVIGAEVLCRRGGCEGLRGVGIRQFCPCLWRRNDTFRLAHVFLVTAQHVARQTYEHPAAGQ